MRKLFAGPAFALLAVLAFSYALRAQTSPPQQPKPVTTHKEIPAPRRDLSGIWEVADRMEDLPGGCEVARSVHGVRGEHRQQYL